MATRPSRAPGRSDPGADGTSPLDGHDWPAEAADSIERVVQGVRDKTTGPAISAARWTVAGLFAAIIGTGVLVLLCILLVRILDVYLPSSVFGDEHVWVAYLIVGLPPLIGGLVLLRRRVTPVEGP
jgi:hypothetical protein